MKAGLFVLFTLILPGIAGASVVFRAAKPSDKRAINILVRDPGYIDYVGGGKPTDPNVLYTLLKNDQNKNGQFVIADGESNKIVGVGSMSQSSSPEFPHKWTFTYAVLPVARGLGYARQAIKEMIRQILSRDNKAEITASAAGLNKISQYLLETEGFIPTDDFDRAANPRRHIHYKYVSSCERETQ